MRNLRSLNTYFLRYKWLLLLGILFVFLSNFFQVYAPRYIRYMIDLVQDKRLTAGAEEGIWKDLSHALLINALLFVGFTVLRGIFLFLMRQTIIVMSRHIEYDQKNDLFAHYIKLTPSFFKRNNTGDLMSRVAEDVGRVRQYVGPAIMYFLNLFFNVILAIWMMMSISPGLTLYVLLPLPVLSVSIYYVNSIINRKSERIQAQLSTLTSMAQESFSGIRVIKAYVQEDTTVRHFGEACDEYKDRSLSLARVDAAFQPLMVLLIGLSTLITIFVGGIQVMEGRITAGNMIEFLFYVNMLTWPVTSLGWVVSIMQRAEASQKRINDFLFTKPDIETTGMPERKIKGAIRFEDVHFTYPETGIQALRNVSFHIEPGQKVAIVGRTGSGKSTVADLLMRMYDPQKGHIYVDDKDITEFNTDDLHAGIAYVPQDVFLFSDTIFHNITFGKPGASLADARSYAGYASILEEIDALPEGMETVIGERGVTLSGGQKQRISIARAFLLNAPVIILDDCLSAVDTHTEKRILGNMRTYLESRTALIITHRVHSLLEYDKIIVLEDTGIAEMGTHAQLMERKGIYFQLFESQRLADAGAGI